MPTSQPLLVPQQILAEVPISRGMIVAELGCGSSGYYVFECAELVGGTGRVYAIDVQPQILENMKKQILRENRDNIETVWADIEQPNSITLSNEIIDISLLINTLFQASNHENMIRESTRILKPHGKLLIVDWKTGNSTLGPTPDKQVNPEKLKTIAEKIGLKLIKEFTPGVYHFGQIYEKGTRN